MEQSQTRGFRRERVFPGSRGSLWFLAILLRDHSKNKEAKEESNPTAMCQIWGWAGQRRQPFWGWSSALSSPSAKQSMFCPHALASFPGSLARQSSESRGHQNCASGPSCLITGCATGELRPDLELSQLPKAHVYAMTHLNCGFFLFMIINCTLENKRNRGEGCGGEDCVDLCVL